MRRSRLLRLPCLLATAVGWSVLPTSAWAQATASAADTDAMAAAYASMGNPGSAARLSDSDATCEALYAESGHLEERIARQPKAVDPFQASMKMQQDMMAAQKKMMSGQRAKGLASSLLGMVPGVGGLAGGLASSAMSRGNGMEAMNDATRKAMAGMQESNQAMMATAQLQMRKAHVTELFLSRNCKVSALDAGLVAASRRQLSQGEDTGTVAEKAAGTAQ